VSDWQTYRKPPSAGLSEWEDLWVRFGPAAEIGRGLRSFSFSQDDLIWLCDRLIEHLRGDDVLTLGKRNGSDQKALATLREIDESLRHSPPPPREAVLIAEAENGL